MGFKAGGDAEFAGDGNRLPKEVHALFRAPGVATGDDGQEQRMALDGRLRLAAERFEVRGNRRVPVGNVTAGGANFRNVIETGIGEHSAEVAALPGGGYLAFDAVEPVFTARGDRVSEAARVSPQCFESAKFHAILCGDRRDAEAEVVGAAVCRTPIPP